MFRAWLVAVFLLTWTASVEAHTRSESYSSWQASEGRLSGILRVDAHRATQLAREPADLADLAALLARHVAVAVTVRQDGAGCPASPPRALTAEAGQLRVEMRFDCPRSLSETAAEVTIGVFREASPGHVHYVRVVQPAGPTHEAVIVGARTAVAIGGAGQPARDGVPTFVVLGLEHVLSGLDHLAFLLALMLLAGRPWNAVLAASGFTVGHSLTLGLVAFGWLRPNTTAIEALIGFTIAVTAALLLAGSPVAPGSLRKRWTWLLLAAAGSTVLPFLAALLGRDAPPWPLYAGIAVFTLGIGAWSMSTAATEAGRAEARLAVVLAMAFGLVHGAGFAGGLLDLDLPKDRLLGALLGFNIGVEAAQLLVLGLCGAAVAMASRLPARIAAWWSFGRHATASALIGLGVYWFVVRSLL